jgi:hypothetical protein
VFTRQAPPVYVRSPNTALVCGQATPEFPVFSSTGVLLKPPIPTIVPITTAAGFVCPGMDVGVPANTVPVGGGGGGGGGGNLPPPKVTFTPPPTCAGGVVPFVAPPATDPNPFDVLPTELTL